MAYAEVVMLVVSFFSRFLISLLWHWNGKVCYSMLFLRRSDVTFSETIQCVLLQLLNPH